jgi:ABC-2 type transport system ATP-binding protein
MTEEKTSTAVSAATPTDAQPTRGADPTSAPAGAKTPGEVLITASGLTKYYGGFTAIVGVSFEVRRGQVVAFLGPNGAGKSTTMRCLTGVLAPDRGEARIAGFNVLEHRIEVAHRLGYLPENGPLYDDMTPEGLLRFFGEARGLDPARLERRIEDVRARLDLGSVMGKAIHKLSRGFRQRVGLAQALLHEPDVLILDEPTNGLDPNQIRDVRKTIREFGRDKAVLLSTHILQEVEAIADRVVFISDGRIVFEGTVDELRATKGAKDLDAAFASLTSGA